MRASAVSHSDLQAHIAKPLEPSELLATVASLASSMGR